MKNMNNKLNGETCPDEILINNYVLHLCSEEERRKIETHLVKCHLCRKEVVLLTKLQSEDRKAEKWNELPEKMIVQGMELVRKFKESHLDKELGHSYEEVKKLIRDFHGLTLEIALKFINGQWTIKHHTGTPQPVLAGRNDVSGQKITIVKEFAGHRVEVNVEKKTSGDVGLQIKAKKLPEGNLLLQVNFILIDEKQQEISKDFIQDGVAFFEGLKPGKYSIEIVIQNKLIGHIPVDLTKE